MFCTRRRVECFVLTAYQPLLGGLYLFRRVSLFFSVCPSVQLSILLQNGTENCLASLSFVPSQEYILSAIAAFPSRNYSLIPICLSC